MNDQFESYHTYIQSEYWRRRRAAFLSTRGNCAWCGTELVKNSHVHHLTYERLRRERDSDLVALCQICHWKVEAALGNTRWWRRGRGSARHWYSKRNLTWDDGYRILLRVELVLNQMSFAGYSETTEILNYLSHPRDLVLIAIRSGASVPTTSAPRPPVVIKKNTEKRKKRLSKFEAWIAAG